jgi:hypothetical protein
MEITAETLGTVETNSSTGTQTTGKYSNFALFNFENKKNLLILKSRILILKNQKSNKILNTLQNKIFVVINQLKNLF